MGVPFLIIIHAWRGEVAVKLKTHEFNGDPTNNKQGKSNEGEGEKGGFGWSDHLRWELAF